MAPRKRKSTTEPSPARADAPASKLSRTAILEAARRTLEAEGLAALSMRRLAQELDVWPMAVYRYFRDKDELLDAVVEDAAQHIPVPAAGAPWRLALTGLLTDAHKVLAGLPTELGQRLVASPALPTFERLSRAAAPLLREASVPDADAPTVWRALIRYTTALTNDRTAFTLGLELLLDGVAARAGTRADDRRLSMSDAHPTLKRAGQLSGQTS